MILTSLALLHQAPEWGYFWQPHRTNRPFERPVEKQQAINAAVEDIRASFDKN